ncbi:MAG: DNA-binding transcriptional regulator [Melioribacteraceae bacterium]|nr:DNA-binding transcriptional regulator [Melioribacteraceae bacterium]
MKKIILLLETSRAFGRQLIIGIAKYSRLNGPWSFYKEPTDLKSSVPHLTSWKPDGIIMRDSLITKELLKLKIPTILAIHHSKYPRDLPVIKTDSYAIAKMASEHLLEKGLKNFAFFGSDRYEWSNERKFFFLNFINDAGFNASVYLPPKKVKKNDWEKEQRHVSEWVKDLPKPVGIFACNDDRGQHILEVCKLLNLRVPEDVSVIGVDNDPMICEIGDPPLTSIALNVESAGYEAAKLMDEMIKNKKISGEHILVSPSHVIQRQSSDVLAVNDPKVSQAISYIKKNAKNKILVKDVVEHTNVSRRTLERKFKQSIRRSIYGEIRRVRIEMISQMLVETDLSISQISSYFNFTDVEHISRYFKIEKGIGLREFRKLNQPK